PPCRRARVVPLLRRPAHVQGQRRAAPRGRRRRPVPVPPRDGRALPHPASLSRPPHRSLPRGAHAALARRGAGSRPRCGVSLGRGERPCAIRHLGISPGLPGAWVLPTRNRPPFWANVVGCRVWGSRRALTPDERKLMSRSRTTGSPSRTRRLVAHAAVLVLVTAGTGAFATLHKSVEVNVNGTELQVSTFGRTVGDVLVA